MKKIPRKWWISPLMLAIAAGLAGICYLVKFL